MEVNFINHIQLDCPWIHLLSVFAAGGEVYVWDLGARDCVRRFVDEGCIRGTSLAISPNNRYLATGSDSGVVNLYDRREVVNKGVGGANPKPLKTFLNLTTSVEGKKNRPKTKS